MSVMGVDVNESCCMMKSMAGVDEPADEQAAVGILIDSLNARQRQMSVRGRPVGLIRRLACSSVLHVVHSSCNAQSIIRLCWG